MKTLTSCLLATAALVAATASSSTSQCVDGRYCTIAPCINPKPAPGLPAGAMTDFKCSNPPATFYGNQCISIDTHEKFGGPGTAWRLLGVRTVCTPPAPKPPLTTNKCGNRLGGAVPGGACGILVGSCGAERVAAGCS